MRIQTIFHTGFVVADLESALDFYVNTLGLIIEREPVEASGHPLNLLVGYDPVRLRMAMVGPGDGNAIELLQYLEPYGEVRPDQNVRYRPGSAHAAFIVDDVAAWRIKLKAAGIVCMGSEEERDVPYPFLRLAIYFQDPDGNWLEMGQRDPDPATPS